MKFLWLTWKDYKHPFAGGAEKVNEELAKRLVQDGHDVIFLVAGFQNAKKEEIIDGYKVIRLGNKWTVYWHAWRYYKKNLVGWADMIIDEVNTIPYFAKFYAQPSVIARSSSDEAISTSRLSTLRTLKTLRTNNILFVHQLCREIWFYQMFFPLNFVGYALESIYLRLLRDREVITISTSTKNDLVKFGFKENKINIISEGIDLAPVESLENLKHQNATILSFGSVRPMKRTMHILRAYEIAKKQIPDLRLVIAGDFKNDYGKKVAEEAIASKYSASIELYGKVSPEKKIELLQRSYLLCAASVKEGWGLVISEANSQGTPAIVYNVDGLRDSVRHNETGIICRENTPESMAESIIEILNDEKRYAQLRMKGWLWSKEINFDKSYNEFINSIK